MSWISEHPSWDFILWTDDMSRPSIHPKMVMRDIKELSDLPLYSYVDRTDNYGEQSDLLRYEILFKEGGVYVDHDIECFHSLDGLIRGLDFFAGLEPPHQNSGIETKIIPCNALIGARKGHPILKSTIDKVQSRWDDIEKTFTSIDAQTKALKVFHRTFHSFTLGVKECIALGANQDILFPASFFYSEAFEDKNEVARWKKKGLIFGLHHCAGEWMPHDEKSFLVSELHKEKGRRHLLEKRYNTLKKLCFFSIALSFLLAGAFFYQRRKRVYG
jgi:hypothetical protein